MRYSVQIRFKNSNSVFFMRVWDINEPMKTLREAQTYKAMVDNTVDSARVVDQINNTVVEIWK